MSSFTPEQIRRIRQAGWTLLPRVGRRREEWLLDQRWRFTESRPPRFGRKGMVATFAKARTTSGAISPAAQGTSAQGIPLLKN